ncbi:hypothetical protein FRC0408_00859 [Corynebacterium diphtheriae]|nr:hypothetical protein FRC0408_00859 [Corynebacterium diphtheriae]
MSALIDTLVGMKDAVVAEIVQLGRTMNKRRKGILAYFDHKQCTLKPEEPVNPSPRDDRCRIVINCWNDHCPLSVEPCVTSNTM